MGGALGKLGGLAGGLMAAKAVISEPLKQARSYDQQLTYMALTATGDKKYTKKDRLEARYTLNEYVKRAAHDAGGTREDIATALNALLASGKYDLKTVQPELNTASKAAFAAGASTEDAANLHVAMSGFGVKNLQLGHDIALRGGELGSFEYRDQAKWLKAQMAAAKSIGYGGEEGLIKLVGLNQIAKTTAASSDEAGNNVVNLLAKLSSRELAESMGRVVKPQKDDPKKPMGKGKNQHWEFDWPTKAINERSQGVYAVDAFVNVLERQFAANPQYAKLKKQMLTEKDGTKKNQTLGAMADIAAGSEIGHIIADRQALMAAYATVYNKDALASLEGQLRTDASGRTDSNLAVVQDTEWAKNQALEQEKLFAQTHLYNSLAESLGHLEGKVVDTAAKHENLAAAAVAATGALFVLAGVKMGSAVLGAGAGVAAGGAGLGTMALLGGIGTAALGVGGMGVGALAGAGVVGGAALAGGVTLAGGVGYGVGTLARMGYMQTETGQNFDNALGEGIAKTLAFFGNDTAQQALETQAAYEAAIEKQTRELKDALQALRPISMPTPTDLLSGLSQSVTQESRRGMPYRP
jgi:uncharacterized membrane protein